MYPIAKTGLIIEQLPAETIVYDPKSHQAHCLNQTVGFVWNQCDGKTTEAEIAKRLPDQIGLPADPDIVRLALGELSRAELLTRESIEELAETFPSRRELARRLALLGASAAALLPAVSSVVAAKPGDTRSGPEGDGRGNGGNGQGGNQGGNSQH